MEQCRAARHCQGLGNRLEAMNTGRYGQAAWQACGCIRPSSFLVAGCALVAGTLSGFRSPPQTPGGKVNWCSSRNEGRFLTSSTSSSVQLPQHTVSCGALALLLRIGEARLCAYCRCLRHCKWLRWCQGFVGITMSGRLIFKEAGPMISARAPVVEHIAPAPA